MKSYVFSTLAVAASIAQAHTTLYALWVNDVDQGLGNTGTGYIRSPPNNNPVKDLTSPDMACNVNNVPAPKYVSVKPGDNVTFEWHHNSRDASDDIIASSHKGPVQVYMAPMTSSQGSGPIWQKIAEHGYDATSKRWAVDDLISNKGKHSIIVPDVADGNYFLRPEIIALHEADTLHDQNSARGAQFYFECAQLKISGGSGSAMPAGVSFPGAYKDSDPGVHFNLYGSFSTYPVPGPTVW
ncbi:lytic polysaccharide monooxygenase, partial [Viridothelium virens]